MEASIENDDEMLANNTKQIKPQFRRKRRHSQTTDFDYEVFETGFNWSSSDNIAGAAGDDVDADDADGRPAIKYREVDTAEFRLDQFSDEVLFEIFKHLDSWTLLALLNSCNRFNSLVQDHRFWQHMDFSKEPLPLGMLESLLERTDANTHTIKLRGPPTAQHVDGEIQQFSKTLHSTFRTRCTKLKTLELQGITLDFKFFNITDIPKTLVRMVFNDCNVRILDPEVKNIFAGIDTHFLELQELGIENSNWFEPHYIMGFSKIPALRWLSLQGCLHLADNFVPYGSMSARFGFKKLEYLDLRFTPIGDSDLQCFNAVATLREILLECPTILPALKNGFPLIEENADVDTAAAAATSNNDTPSTSKSAASTASFSSSSSSPSAAASASSAAQFNVTISMPAANANNDAVPAVQCLRAAQQQELDSPSSSSSSTSSSAASSPANSAPSSPPSAAAAAGAVAPPLLVNWNFPARSRFLPRPDQIIYLDAINRRRPIIMPPRRPPNNNDDQLDQVLMNPIFWDMIYPLGRRGQNAAIRRNPEGAVAGRLPSYMQRISRNSAQISDRGVCAFGRPPNPVDDAIIWIGLGYRPVENRFERMSVRNYKQVTDISLTHLMQCSPHLVYLDISGTGVTRAGIQKFNEQKPECHVVADHLTEEAEAAAAAEATEQEDDDEVIAQPEANSGAV